MNKVTRCAIELYRSILEDRATIFKHEDNLYKDICSLRDALTCVLICDKLDVKYTPVMGEHINDHNSNLWLNFQRLLNCTQEEDEIVMRHIIGNIISSYRRAQRDG